MHCPRCHTIALADQELETSLPSLHCPQCQGHWIRGIQYWKWLEGHGTNLPERPASEAASGEEAAPPVSDAGGALICPDCGHILGRYHVGHDIAFTLDHCAHCSGVWFDGGEWETLKSRNLHDDVHAIFSDVWQARVRRGEQAREHERNLEALLGEEDLSELRRMKSWLMAHPKRYAMYALLHPDNVL